MPGIEVGVGPTGAAVGRGVGSWVGIWVGCGVGVDGTDVPSMTPATDGSGSPEDNPGLSAPPPATAVTSDTNTSNNTISTLADGIHVGKTGRRFGAIGAGSTYDLENGDGPGRPDLERIAA
ncbi:MAG: hypothetical protein ACRDHN_01975 [Thermomicrobiales bacterium]